MGEEKNTLSGGSITCSISHRERRTVGALKTSCLNGQIVSECTVNGLFLKLFLISGFSLFEKLKRCYA